MYHHFRAKAHLTSLPAKPIIWPVVANTITGIKMRTQVAVEAASVATEIEARKHRVWRGRFGR